ncbi:MAG: tetratricopeptide repeat protein [Spirochaetales bacterium]|nr:tetratricopeptide repeat protein [Spirochaetales bacterium]
MTLEERILMRSSGNVSEEDVDIEELILRSYDLFHKGSFQEAEKLYEQALAIDFENLNVIAGLKCSKYWIERKKYLSTIDSDDFARSEYLYNEWKAFTNFLSRLKTPFRQGVSVIKQWVFQTALRGYLNTSANMVTGDDEILLRIGKCYKGMGDYDKALEYLESVSRKRRDDPEVMGELADCYAFINETRAAKAFFREAFFIDAQRVNIDFLESELIMRLIEKLRDIGYSEEVLKEWMPVHAVLWGVFNVKRELKPLELGKLKQSIFSLENRITDTDLEDERAILVPRLINHYFWLIDHYVITGETREKVEEVLRKINAIDESVYEQYIN